MASLQDLLDQKAALEKEIEVSRRQAKTDGVVKVKTLMAEYGLSISDLATKVPAKTTGGKVAAKYRNATTGETWSGRGLQPKWLKAALAAGRSIEDFAV